MACVHMSKYTCISSEKKTAMELDSHALDTF